MVTMAMSQDAFGQASLDITLKHGTPEEARTRDQLQRLLATYDLCFGAGAALSVTLFAARLNANRYPAWKPQ